MEYILFPDWLFLLWSYMRLIIAWLLKVTAEAALIPLVSNSISVSKKQKILIVVLFSSSYLKYISSSYIILPMAQREVWPHLKFLVLVNDKDGSGPSKPHNIPSETMADMGCFSTFKALNSDQLQKSCSIDDPDQWLQQQGERKVKFPFGINRISNLKSVSGL